MCCVLGPTVTIVSAKGKTFGGFAEASWIPSRAEWQESAGNFLFMVDPHIKLTCNEPTHAQYSCSDYGPVFGYGHDLIIDRQWLFVQL